MSLRDWVLGLLGRGPTQETGPRVVRGHATHVIILDGTASSLMPGCETNAGLTYQLLREVGSRGDLSIYYEAGIQWQDWRGTWDVMTGNGINRQIRRAYGVLASRYRPGDKIVLVGYSRGAYAVRSLAGVLDMVGLLKPEAATVSNIRTAYRHYQAGATSQAAAEFRRYCHDDAPIEAVAVWDTVKALGFRFPLIWRWTMRKHAFHNHALGPSIRNGFHAVARDETRMAYAPVMWMCPVEWQGRMEQVWFKGTHADIGGQVGPSHRYRPLSNIPLVWMLEQLEQVGMPLPEGWKNCYPQDVETPSIGRWHGWSKLFLHRRKRKIGVCRSESLHRTIAGDVSDDARDAIPIGSGAG